MPIDPANETTWRGKRVTVMGLGLFGGSIAAAKFAARAEAEVTVTDIRDESKLGESIEALNGLPIRFVLGGHEEDDFAEADLVIASPAVPPTSEYLRLALDAGVPTTTEIVLFLQRFRGPVIAVSGSNGKTTTATLIGDIMRAHDPRAVLGGNLGRSLLLDVDNLPQEAPATLELSSFQLEWLGKDEWSPDVGVITNLAPNHLDWHGTFEAYADAKWNLLRFMSSSHTAVLNAADSELMSRALSIDARVATFHLDQPQSPGAWVERDTVFVDVGGGVEPVLPVAEIPLVGMHNVENVLAAACATAAFGVPVETIAGAIRAFQAVEHRLEMVAERRGVKYFNDSIATTPESSICALRSFEPGTVILLAGGYDKGMPFDEMGREIAERAKALIVFGTTAPKIADAATSAGFPVGAVHGVENMSRALAVAADVARAGDVVVLSPACASYDQFRNAHERGTQFREQARSLPS